MSNIGFGYAGWLALGQETTFGTPPTGTNEVQALTPNSAPSAGHITISQVGINGTQIVSGNINATDNTAAIQATLDAAYGASQIVAGGSLATALTLTYSGNIYANKNVPQVTVPTNTLSGGSYASLTPSTTTPGVAPTLVPFELLDEGIELKQTRTPKPVLGTTSETHSVKSKSDVSGSFKFQAQFSSGLMRILYNAFGAVVDATASGETTVYTHTYSRTDALPTGLSLWIDRDSNDIGCQFLYTGCQIDKLTLEQGPDDMLTVTADIVGRGQEILTYPIPKPALPTFNQIDWLMVSSVTINSVSIPAKKLKVVLDNKLNKDRYLLGSNFRNGVQRSGVAEVTGTVELEFQSTAQILLFENYTQFETDMTWTGPNVSGSAVPTPFSLAIKMKNCSISGKTPNVKDWSVIQQEIDFMAFSSNVGALDEISAVLTNDLAAMV